MAEYIFAVTECTEYPIKTPQFFNMGELIRCRECKHWDGYFCHHDGYGDGYANYTPPIKTQDGFCDWAERKEE